MDWLGKIIIPAIEMFLLSEDRILLTHNVQEPAIVASIFCNMKQLMMYHRLSNLDLQNLSVDNEYNKNFYGPKSARIKEKCKDCDINLCMAKQIIERGIIKIDMKPDIIIHQRISNNHNKVVIEFKKYNRDEGRDNDFAKLAYFTCQEPFSKCEVEEEEKKNYKYKHGYFIDLGENSCEIISFEDGKARDCKNYVFYPDRIECTPCKKR